MFSYHSTLLLLIQFYLSFVASYGDVEDQRPDGGGYRQIGTPKIFLCCVLGLVPHIRDVSVDRQYPLCVLL